MASGHHTRLCQANLIILLLLSLLLIACNGGEQDMASRSGPSATPDPSATITPTEPPTSTPDIGRGNCEQIRGTDYVSPGEREWFLVRCLTPPAGQTSSTPVVPPLGGGLPTALVVRVIDGDTIEIEGGARVRYIGMDTPEASGQCFAQEATARNEALVLNRVVELEKDVSEVDPFDRLLRYVYVDGVMVNEVLVAEGYAEAVAYEPDVKYQGLLDVAENQAIAQGLGVWSACASPTQAPAVSSPTQAPPVAGSCPQGCTSPPAGCVIKGNISQSSGEKIYHVTGGGSYEETRISPDFGERWFCTDQEAIANGWRKARN
jgi:micrococcal nuclease